MPCDCAQAGAGNQRGFAVTTQRGTAVPRAGTAAPRGEGHLQVTTVPVLLRPGTAVPRAGTAVSRGEGHFQVINSPRGMRTQACTV